MNNSIEKIFKILDFVNENFTNLQSLTFEILMWDRNLHLTKDDVFQRDLDCYKKFISNKDKFIVYNQKLKVQLDHKLCFIVRSRSKTAVRAYLKDLKSELQGFEYSRDGYMYESTHYYRKSSNIKTNFEANIELCLECDIDENGESGDEDIDSEAEEEYDFEDEDEDESMSSYDNESDEDMDIEDDG